LGIITEVLSMFRVAGQFKLLVTFWGTCEGGRVKTISLAVVSFVAGFLCFARAEAPGRDGTPGAPIVRSIELDYPGVSAASRKRILRGFRNLVGHHYSERSLEESIRTMNDGGEIGGCRVFGEPVADGVKVVISVYLVYRVKSATAPPKSARAADLPALTEVAALSQAGQLTLRTRTVASFSRGEFDDPTELQFYAWWPSYACRVSAVSPAHEEDPKALHLEYSVRFVWHDPHDDIQISSGSLPADRSGYFNFPIGYQF
jgi:hypothetical protein